VLSAVLLTLSYIRHRFYILWAIATVAKQRKTTAVFSSTYPLVYVSLAMRVAAAQRQNSDRISALKAGRSFPLLQNVQTASRTPPPPSTLLYNGYQVSFKGQKRPECEVTTDFYLVPKLRVSGSILLLPDTPSCLGKGKLYLVYIYILYIYAYTYIYICVWACDICVIF
jgi:hypothetical protein